MIPDLESINRLDKAEDREEDGEINLGCDAVKSELSYWNFYPKGRNMGMN
ncbi:hypothetical protein CFPU101_13910 [Chroococcus sp. FPU101]|nr:hypothetical protein CFPU101_13910 [Chroococcus sp. FPU101]